MKSCFGGEVTFSNGPTNYVEEELGKMSSVAWSAAVAIVDEMMEEKRIRTDLMSKG